MVQHSLPRGALNSQQDDAAAFFLQIFLSLWKDIWMQHIDLYFIRQRVSLLERVKSFEFPRWKGMFRDIDVSFILKVVLSRLIPQCTNWKQNNRTLKTHNTASCWGVNLKRLVKCRKTLKLNKCGENDDGKSRYIIVHLAITTTSNAYQITKCS